MADSDTKRCAELAEWQGWKWVAPVRNLGFWCAPDGTSQYKCPDYATNSAAALALLDWLAKEPRGWHAVISMGHESTCVQYICPGEQYNPALSAKSDGPPSVAWTRAIFEAACEVMDAKKESEVRDYRRRT